MEDSDLKRIGFKFMFRRFAWLKDLFREDIEYIIEDNSDQGSRDSDKSIMIKLN